MNKHVIITGSQGNLGGAVTNIFSENGFQVSGTVEPGKLRAQSEGNVNYHEVNLLDHGQTESWVKTLIEEKSTVDAIVCLVGGFAMDDLLGSNPDSINKMIQLNFYSAYNTIHSVLKHTKNQKEPINIVLIGAKPAVEDGAGKGVFPYALSKSMVIELAKTINLESKELNAYATVVVPSIIDTPPNREAMPDADFTNWVTPKSIAQKIYFACSEEGRDLRGTVLKVYGDS